MSLRERHRRSANVAPNTGCDRHCLYKAVAKRTGRDQRVWLSAASATVPLSATAVLVMV
jgi:hypothetical protein